MTHPRVLVVGDAHVDPDQLKGNKLRRFTWLGRLIEQEKPSHVVFIGDFVTMTALSHWDKDKRRKIESKRFQLDMDAGNKALDLMFNEISPSVLKNIEFIYVEGNHEDWQEKYFDYDPSFEGAVDYKTSLDLAGRGFKFIPYKSSYKLRGVSFTHTPIGANGKSPATKYPAQKGLELYDRSVVFGHTHKLAIACEHKHDAPSLNQSLNVGCFFEHIDEYAQGSTTHYWRGLVLLDLYDHNRFDIQTFALGRLKRMFER